ncbi:MAG: cryptochrome/photolyase family protein [Planctomycetes bacterium]|nr:cryptochrome/photolyase family protein [Planctomycetota bacterium]
MKAKTTQAAVVYPHQLFPDTRWLLGIKHVYVVEDPLLFRQYRFCRQKLMLHRASMKRYADGLKEQGKTVHYIDAMEIEHTGELGSRLEADKVHSLRAMDPEDHNLLLRLGAGCRRHQIELAVQPDPHFLTSVQDIEEFVGTKKKLFFTNFYIEQRKRLGVLLEQDQRPQGGKWSFDTENRKRLPAGHEPPECELAAEDAYSKEASKYIGKHFSEAYGDPEPLWYPTSAQGCQRHLKSFLAQRFGLFGDYEDSISREHVFLYHSVITPMLNVGLISPEEVVEAVLKAGQRGRVPMNSLEGFVRQVIGWREYMRLVYRKLGTQQRTRNYWGHARELPRSFYDGTTGIEPVDQTIRRVLKYGYCHHIERLMILGNFMLLCEFHPDAIYRWFMELFVDAYDWVMVPNVYGMSQHADGGLITTKPYISGSSYVLKMSDYKKGAWAAVWDGLYWRFVSNHREFFSRNPRMKVMVSQVDRMGQKLQEHHRNAEQFLSTL